MSAAPGIALIVVAVLGAAAAVAALLLIKVTRRRQATREGRSSDVVPARPMSGRSARRIARRYALVLVALIPGLLILLALAAES